MHVTAFFEPGIIEGGLCNNPIERGLKTIERAFRWHKPAIISSHRVNFVGFLNPQQREHGLDLLDKFLAEIIKRWPDVEFMSSVELGDIMAGKRKMMETPLVSIIMPVYNGASTIRLALQSLLVQTYSNWLCIIVNDGSTDGTKEILDSLTDSRFKVYHLPKNMGRGYARQVALDHVEGEFIAYLDADDFYHREKIQRQMDVMISDFTIDLVACGLLTFWNGWGNLSMYEVKGIVM